MAWALTAAVALPCLGSATEPAYRDPGLSAVIQVAIVTRDIEASAKRWADFLGIPVPKVMETKPGHEVKMTYKGQPSDARVKLAFIKSGQVQIELLQPVGGPSSWKDGLDANGEGFHHLGFGVKDLNRSLAAIEAMGYPVLHRGRYDSDDGTYVYMDSRKGLGVMVELLHSDPPKK
jgi:catechol 2,3-dioxygenase-like lactoylglutathione lyase family enzyme